MSHFRRNTPSLNALVALEAAARHRSFTRAAQELGVTQAAVSRQIIALETELGLVLFHRLHRAIEPTGECLTLAAALGGSFATIVESVDQVRSAARQQVVTIGATLAFSTLWLMPRLPALRSAFPGIQVRLISRDTVIDLDAREADVAIRFGVPPFDDGHLVSSRSDELFPVCSPAFLARIGSPEQFLAAPYDLIESDAPDRQWYSWPMWNERAGAAAAMPRATLHFNQYTDVLEAARAGQGVGLGWGLLCSRYLAAGTLVRLGTQTVKPDGRYNIVLPRRERAKSLGEAVARWLDSEMTGPDGGA